MRFEKLPPGYWRAPNCMIVADVMIGENSSIWFGAVIRGDVAPVIIGKRVNVQDNAVIHCDSGIANQIDEDVTIAHSAVVHGKHVGRGSIIGIGALVLGRTDIGQRCFVAAGAVVPPGLVVPDGMMVMGVPGKIVRPVKEEELKYMKWLTEHYQKLAERYGNGEFE